VALGLFTLCLGVVYPGGRSAGYSTAFSMTMLLMGLVVGSMMWRSAARFEDEKRAYEERRRAVERDAEEGAP